MSLPIATNQWAHDRRKDFPQYSNQAWSYLDSAATTLKPRSVIDRLTHFYSTENAPTYRSIYAAAEHATQLYEDVRTLVARFVNAQNASEIIFTRGTTESINLVAYAWACNNLKKDDVILLTELEHHANILPWQHLEKTIGIRLVYVPLLSTGELDYHALEHLVTPRVRLIAVTLCSNIFGVPVALEPFIHAAQKVNAKLLIDAAQAAPHAALDVQHLACDFLAFSSHKMLGPAGVGLLYVKHERYVEMIPYQRGGGMAEYVGLHDALWQKPPYQFEAGTQAVADVIAYGSALEYVRDYVDFATLQQHTASLCTFVIEQLSRFSYIKLYGPLETMSVSGHCVLFSVDGMHPHDVATYLDHCGIAVRAGYLCAQPAHDALKIPATVRASFYCYTTYEDCLKLVMALSALRT